MVLFDGARPLLYLLPTILSLGLAGVLWRHRDAVGVLPLLAMNLSIGYWMGCLFLVTIVPDNIALLFLRISFLGVGVFLASFIVFALEYTGREQYITKRVLALLSVHPIALFVLAVFNPGSVFFVDIEPVPVASEHTMGSAFYVHTAYGYVIAITAVVLIVAFLIRSRHSIYRGQALTVLAAFVAPMLFSTVHIFVDVQFNTGTLGVVALPALLTVSIYRYQLTDLTPIAREKVVDNVRDGIVIVDTEHRIVDRNQSATRLLTDADTPVGERITDAVPDGTDVAAELRDLLDEDGASERTVRLGGEFLTIESTPIEDSLDRHSGWVLVFQNITERITREQELKRKNERLNKFASMVSHDLRSPLNVAQLRADLIDQDRSDDHSEAVLDALDRMETMIDEMLALARAGDELKTTEECVLVDLVEQSWEHIRTDGARLDSRLDDETVEGDSNQLLHVFENLFKNALEHNDDPVTIRVGPLETAEGFYVQDSGEGIPAARHTDIFEHGYTTSEDGEGLGLVIVEDIIETHGWNIRVPRSEDGGARFEIHTDS